MAFIFRKSLVKQKYGKRILIKNLFTRGREVFTGKVFLTYQIQMVKWQNLKR